ncbi:MAG: hypothetical protein IPH24_12495 [Crocinitomicaceae bacterium]|nr:hypothetical protein [Crocinitomicaceae bacterium]
MSVFNFIDNAKFQFGRFFLALGFLICGIILLKIAMVPEEVLLNNGEMLPVKQSPLFLYGAIFFIVGSVIWFLYLFGVINTLIGYVIMFVMAGSSVYLLYRDFKTVNDDVQYLAEYKKMNDDIIARMNDIKEAEVAFKEYNKYFTNNMDSLIHFVKTGKKMSVPNIGSLPERRITPEERDYIYGDNRPIDKLMTEQEAHALAKSPNPPADLLNFKRDTIYLSVLDAIFYDDKFVERRSKLGDNLMDFHPDSLRFVPYTQTPVQLDTNSVMKGEIRVPTLRILMVHPMDPEKKYQIGDLNDNHLRDNWSR